MEQIFTKMIPCLGVRIRKTLPCLAARPRTENYIMSTTSPTGGLLNLCSKRQKDWTDSRFHLRNVKVNPIAALIWCVLQLKPLVRFHHIGKWRMLWIRLKHIFFCFHFCNVSVSSHLMWPYHVSKVHSHLIILRTTAAAILSFRERLQSKGGALNRLH